MPETFDIDRAFDDFTRDVETHANPPGAQRAQATDRHRRTTKLTGGAAVAALLIAGAVLAQRGGPQRAAVEPAAPSSSMPTRTASSTLPPGYVYQMTGPTGPQLRQAFGAWAGGYVPHPPDLGETWPKCLHAAPAASVIGDGVGSAAFAELATYPSSDQSAADLSAIAQALPRCGFQITNNGPSDVLVATRDGAKAMTIWFHREGTMIGSVQLYGWSAPPADVDRAVVDLLTAAIATAKPTWAPH